MELEALIFMEDEVSMISLILMLKKEDEWSHSFWIDGVLKCSTSFFLTSS